MPELPEVHTTATMLHRLVAGKVIQSVWTDYKSAYHRSRANIKDPKYFKKFTEQISNRKIIKVFRRAKNVLIDVDGGKTILIHMKMTGHLLYGKYIYNKKSNKWSPRDKLSSLAGPFSRFIHLVFTLSDGKHIAFSDMRKFATVTLIPDKVAFDKTFEKVGPEPLEKSFDWHALRARLTRRPNGKIKTILMDHSVIAGIGNIYSDEILWASSIHPERKVSSLKDLEIKEILKNTKKLLTKGIDFGGDSMSDYRNPLGEKGKFQEKHEAYRRTGLSCRKKGCKGKIIKKIIGQRSAHFCNVHQK